MSRWRPLPGVSCYILDGDMRAVADGEVGELYIGGAQLAEGYLNDPSLTREKFVEVKGEVKKNFEVNEVIEVTPSTLHPSPSTINVRLHATGDMVRRLPSGEMEYCGRRDAQVKIRGHRVELDEIAAQALRYPGVKQAVARIEEARANDEKIVIYGVYFKIVII